MDRTFTLPGIQDLFPGIYRSRVANSKFIDPHSDLDKWRASKIPQLDGTKSQRRIPRLNLIPPAKLLPSSSPSRQQTACSSSTSEHSEYRSSTDANDYEVRREIPIQCATCDKTFRHVSSLTMHQNIHTGLQRTSCIQNQLISSLTWPLCSIQVSVSTV